MEEKFSNQEISDYYDLTEIHYKRGWDLNRSKALHYGFWDRNTKDFSSALHQMNEELAAFSGISENAIVLDAGCGVGGSSVFLAKKYDATVTGVSLNEKQIEEAKKYAISEGVGEQMEFEKEDFTNTSFPENHFDVIWCLESVIHIVQKESFFREAHRILKRGGRLVVADYFCSENISEKGYEKLMKWLNPWAISKIETIPEYLKQMESCGISVLKSEDVSQNIRKSSWRMYYGSFYLRFMTFLYKLYNPKVSTFSKNHHKAMYHQYPALRKGYWKYYFVLGKKM